MIKVSTNNFIEFIGKKLVSDTELSTQTRERLQKIQDEFVSRGLVDIRLSWDKEKLSLELPSLDSVANELCDILEADLRGEYTTSPPFNDSNISKPDPKMEEFIKDCNVNDIREAFCDGDTPDQKIDNMFAEFERKRKAHFDAVPYPKYICPFCGCAHTAEEHEKDLANGYADYLCGVCENRTLSEYVRVEGQK